MKWGELYTTPYWRSLRQDWCGAAVICSPASVVQLLVGQPCRRLAADVVVSSSTTWSNWEINSAYTRQCGWQIWENKYGAKEKDFQHFAASSEARCELARRREKKGRRRKTGKTVINRGWKIEPFKGGHSGKKATLVIVRPDCAQVEAENVEE